MTTPDPALTGEMLAEMRERIERARRKVSDLCEGRDHWHMSVPALPDSDPDLVIADGLKAGLDGISAASRTLAAEYELKRFKEAAANRPDYEKLWAEAQEAPAQGEG